MISLTTTDTGAHTLYEFNHEFSGGVVTTEWYGRVYSEPGLVDLAAPISVSWEGETLVDFWSQRRSGGYSDPADTENPHHVYVRIDRSKPTVSSNAVAEYTSTANIKVTAIDKYSGLAGYQVRLDSEATVTVPCASNSESYTVACTTKGDHQVSYWAVDKVGRETTGTISFAIKEPQSVSVAAPTTVTYGSKAKFSGTVTNAAGPVASKLVTLQMLSGTTWSNVATSATGPTGAYAVYSPSLTAARSFRVLGANDAVYATGISAVKVVKPTASLSNPVAPTTMYRTKYYAVYGYLKPRHVSGSYSVRIYKYRYVSGVWKSYGYVNARSSNYSTYSKYSASVKLPYAGRWRLRAYHADVDHAATWSSGYDYITVK